MANIIDYIHWRGDLDFGVSPFNEVDSLIFTEISYMTFDKLEAEIQNLSFEAIGKLYDSCCGDEQVGALLTGPFSQLLRLMADSKRFGNLVVRDFVNILDDEIEMQFSALTIELDEHTAYVAYRGTDDTLVGWKEDFKMTFLDAVPAQIQAAAYLETIMGRFDYGRVYLGGHSKGGNLAVYAAAHATEAIKDKIVRVYNNDGPGFSRQLIESDHYMNIAPKIQTLIPQSSVVGMLLEHKGDYEVVKSTQRGLLQHDGFSWEVLGTGFVHLVDVDDESRMVDMTLTKTLNAMTLDQREQFTQVFFEVLSANNNRTLDEIQKDGWKSLISMRKSFNSLDRVTKKAIMDVLSVMFSEGINSFWEVSNADQWQESLQNWHKDIKETLADNHIVKSVEKALQKQTEESLQWIEQSSNEISKMLRKGKPGVLKRQNGDERMEADGNTEEQEE